MTAKPFLIALFSLLALLALASQGPVQARVVLSVDHGEDGLAMSDGATDALAYIQMAMARYYFGRRDHTGAINRCKVVLVELQTSSHVEEALARLTEAYLALGIIGEAQTAAAVLARKFPNSRWSAMAADDVKAAGLDPLENRRSSISEIFK